MRKIIYPLIAIFLFISPAFAQTVDYCLDNSTLRRITEVKIEVPERNITRTINTTEDLKCPYGCQNDECLKSPSSNWMLALFIIAGILVLILIIWWLFR